MHDDTVFFHRPGIRPEALIALFDAVGFNRLGEWCTDSRPAIMAHTDHWVVAQKGPELVGFVRLLTDWHTRGYISNLCVSPGFQGRGIGRALLAEILRVCDDRRIRVLNVYDTSGKPTLYRDAGFQSDPMATGLHRILPDAGTTLDR